MPGNAGSLSGKELNKEEEADEGQRDGSQRRKTDREGSMGGGQHSLAELSMLEGSPSIFHRREQWPVGPWVPQSLIRRPVLSKKGLW